MKEMRFTTEETLRIIEEVETGVKTVLFVCRKQEISDAAFTTGRRNTQVHQSPMPTGPRSLR
jgi:transposase-like protein